MNARVILLLLVVLGVVAIAALIRTPHGANTELPPGGASALPGADEPGFTPGKASLTETTEAKVPTRTTPTARSVTSSMSSTSSGSTPLSSADGHEAFVRNRIAQLQDLSMEDDTASLETILSELTNRDPLVRKAALEAAVQFGSRDAIPRLIDAAAQTEDPQEKQALLEAADFLKLPSLTEVMQQRATKPVLQPRPAVGRDLPAFSGRKAGRDDGRAVEPGQ